MPSGLRSVTIIGPTLALVDAYATAAFAVGEPGLAWVAARPGFGAAGITAADRVVWTELADGLLDRDASVA